MLHWVGHKILGQIRHLSLGVLVLGVSLSFVCLYGADAVAQQGTTLRVAIGGLPTYRGNPFRTAQTPTITVISAIFDSLTHLRSDGTVAPWLATTWRAVDDFTWEFKLRDDVNFANGAPFNANTVVFFVNYIAGPGPATQDLRRELSILAGARAIDEQTVQITTKKPVPLLPRYASIMLMPEPAAWGSLGLEGFAEQPVGTGPFVLDRWEPSGAYMYANNRSWRPPMVDRVEVLGIRDGTARIQALQSDRIDIAVGIASDDFGLVAQSGGRVATYREGAVNGIFLRTDRNNPLSDRRVRRALNLAVDRQTIVDVLLGGRTELSGQPAVATAYGYNSAIKPYPHDPEAARALMLEAGYPDGFTFVVETSAGDPNLALVLQRVAADLKSIGVNMEIQSRPLMVFLGDFVRGSLTRDAFTLVWGATPTLDAVRAIALHSCQKPAPWYCDKRITPTIEAAVTEWDNERAIALRQQIMKFYHDEAPSIFLYESVGFSGLHKRVRGFRYTYGKINYHEISLKN